MKQIGIVCSSVYTVVSLGIVPDVRVSGGHLDDEAVDRKIFRDAHRENGGECGRVVVDIDQGYSDCGGTSPWGGSLQDKHCHIQ